MDSWPRTAKGSALGLHEPKLRHLAGEAGFGQVRRVEMDNPLSALYEFAR